MPFQSLGAPFGPPAEVLDSLGISATGPRDATEALVRAFFSQLDIAGEVVSLRFGVLTLRASAFDAHLLRLSADQLRDRLATELPGVVDDVRITVDRG